MIYVLILGALMMLAGLVATLVVLRRGEDPQEGNRYSVGMVLVGLGCLLVMGSLVMVW